MPLRFEAGQITAEVDALGNPTQHSYNVVGQRISTTDAQNNVTQFEYDVHGNRTAMIDALNRRAEYIYDAADQLVEVRYADASTTQTGYDATGRRTDETDQAAITTQYVYDEQGRLTQVIDTLGGTTSYSYDEQGNKLTQTDADNRTTRWAYDSLGRVLSRTLPLGQSETFAYDVNGNLTSHIDFNGNATTHQYDSDNRLIQSDYADGTVEVVGYDNNGNRSQVDVTRPGGGLESTLYTYDASNRLETEVEPDGSVLTYQYDAAGNRIQVHISLPDGSSKTTDYGYDSLNRLETVTDTSGTTSYGYDAVGNRTSVSYPNGSSEVYQYNNLNRLTRKETYNGAGTLVQAYDYTLHVSGRRTDIEELSGRNTHYSYDDLYRLTGETITDSQNGNYSASYQYDAVGNRTYSTIDGVQTAYTYDDNDRLTQQGGTSYTYDENGNTLTETLDTSTITYSYNAKNELMSVEQGGNTTEYAYNPNGIRTSKQENGVATRYIVDENRDYAQVLIEDDGTAQVSYSYGDDLISQERNGEAYFYHYDGLGSTRSLTDSLGSLANTYDYEAFGEVLGQTGSVENGYLFAGEQFDPTLDQYYLRARHYDQSAGRFTSMDSWQGNPGRPITLNKYAYADADPANKIDPSGHMSLGSQMTAMNIQSTLSTVAVRAGYLMRAYDTAQAAAGFFEFANAVRQVMGQATSFSASDATRSGIPSGVNMRDALESAAYNLPKAIAAGVYDWGKGYANSKKRGHKLRSFLVYMPLLSPGVGGAIPIRTPAKVRFGKEKIPVKLVFGSTGRKASGSLFGIGMEMGALRQLIRMDYHQFNPGHGGVSGLKSNEIAVWRDGSFHYHVNKW